MRLPELQISKNRALIFLILAIGIKELLMWNAKINYGTDSQWMWQFLSIADLEKDISSIYYLHSQPPLWNFFYYISNYLGFENHLLLAINKISSYLSAYFILRILELWGNKISIATLGAVIFLMLPETIAYEMWDYSCQFTMMLITWNLFIFSKIALTENNKSSIEYLIWILSFAILGFTRQTYSIFFFLVLIPFFSYFALNIKYKKIILCMALISIPFLAWQGKNLYFFGDASMSSWGGRNLFRMASLRLTNEELKLASSQGCNNIINTDPFNSTQMSFHQNAVKNNDQRQARMKQEMPTGNSSSNTFEFLSGSRLYMEGFICVVNKYPHGYFLSLVQSWALYFTPVTDYLYVKKYVGPWIELNSFINKYIYLQPHVDSPGIKSFTARALSRSFTAIFIFLFFSVVSIRLLQSKTINKKEYIVIYATTLVWINSLSNFFDAGENMRFRYDLNAVYYLSLFYLMSVVNSKYSCWKKLFGNKF